MLARAKSALVTKAEYSGYHTSARVGQSDRILQCCLLPPPQHQVKHLRLINHNSTRRQQYFCANFQRFRREYRAGVSEGAHKTEPWLGIADLRFALVDNIRNHNHPPERPELTCIIGHPQKLVVRQDCTLNVICI